MDFIPIQVRQHLQYILPFRRDSFIVSFGTDANFNAREYLEWLEMQQVRFPEGFMLAIENGVPIGQLEVTRKDFEGKPIGYVNLYYLIPEKRGSGLGAELHAYAMSVFKKHQLEEYHLRVSPTNKQAISFYEKMGMKWLKPEMDGKVFRRAGKV
ncbi:GNAT family N-acetyltransferase [Weizmannia sp. CD-2023]|uniref:GNAT family N-acetyltransferase n=1 Tax=Weizmannia sp. CD-2023 TaxID=3037263 RepID=UPI002E1E2B0A|nr:GNAT family N-acetyltransferase [Weizmannia sp. CD-2023]